MNARLLAAAAIAIIASNGPVAGEPARPLLIATGPVVGIYFPAGGAICNMMNRAAGAPVCAVVSSEGSAANLETLAAGMVDLAIVQSDWQYHAVRMNGAEGQQNRFEGLRAAFSLHGEPVTIVARPDAGITGLEDLKGKRINLGLPGSPGRISAEALLAAMDWSLQDLGAVAELAPEHQPSALCNGAIDAYILPTAHPSGAVAEATKGCGARLVPITGVPAERLVSDNPFYAFATIPGGTYDGNPDPVASLGLKATVVTRADVDPDRIFALVKAVFDDFAYFAGQHPAFAGLEPKAMAHDANTAPLHEGALRYYKERGWR
ncbi:MAG TPA: TAXI family TRAP transporter solute-binding subunit [Alphaproteobacteria bacterium]|nr:TAXI family TRAP transporter solute-binding subunit [Alphaproteobacteria bacterium]